MIQRGDIFLVDFGNREGHVQRGVRPAVVVQNDVGNRHSPTAIVAPLTSRSKKALPTHVTMPPGAERGICYASTALLEQISTVDKEMLIRKMGSIRDTSLLDEIDAKIMISLGLRED